MEQFLTQCLDSILCQTYKDFEVILVDDGSPDGSGAICDAYAQKDSRFRVIHQKNAGVSAARNNGIEMAAGEWITFIDSDDWVNPNYLANFQLDDSDGIDLVIQGLEYYDHRSGQFFNSWSFNNVILERKNFRLGFAENRLMELGFPIGKAYRKTILTTNRLCFDSRISFHEDHIFVLDYYQLCYKIRLVDATDYKYRCYHTNSSLSTKPHPWEKMNLAGDEMLQRFLSMRNEYFTDKTIEANRLYDFAYSCKVTAADSVIMSDMPYRDKKLAFRKIINHKDIKYYSHPVTFRGKMVRFLYAYMPFVFGYAYYQVIKLLKRMK